MFFLVLLCGWVPFSEYVAGSITATDLVNEKMVTSSNSSCYPENCSLLAQQYMLSYKPSDTVRIGSVCTLLSETFSKLLDVSANHLKNNKRLKNNKNFFHMETCYD